jgi:hypothetical protein
MDRNKILFLGGLVAAVVVFGWIVLRKNKNTFMLETTSTDPEVEFIQGQPNTHIIYQAQRGDIEIINDEDAIALNPGMGIGQGTYGFGRYGSSFMA